MRRKLSDRTYDDLGEAKEAARILHKQTSLDFGVIYNSKRYRIICLDRPKRDLEAILIPKVIWLVWCIKAGEFPPRHWTAKKISLREKERREYNSGLPS